MNKELKGIAVIIPAYKPGEALTGLSKELMETGLGEIIVVDDGSGEKFSGLFEKVKSFGCTILVHEKNRGKGRALKTAFEYVLKTKPDYKAVVTADADGQHLLKDIINVGRKTLENTDTLMLGSRMFKGKVPLKSRLGNAITRAVFNFVSGQKVFDTQTGLRGVPVSALKKMLKMQGERYEFEMNMLLEAKKQGLAIKEEKIETVYINDNASSHFNPFVDSWKIYKQIIMFSGATIYRHLVMFGGSSLLAFGVDYLVFTLLNIMVPKLKFINLPEAQELLIAVVGARLISSTVNFLVNRNVVFAKKGDRLFRHITGYYILVAVIMTANYFILLGFKSVGLNIYIAKIITEAILFICSFFVQKRIIFR